MEYDQMLPPISIGLILLGFALFIAGGFCRGYVRSRLRESRIELRRWVTLEDDLRDSQKYFQLVRTHRFPMWPLILSVAGFPCGFLSLVLAIVLGVRGK
jgi:hypothetical protein